MIDLKPTRLAAIACFAIGCGGPSVDSETPEAENHEIAAATVVESQAAFAPKNTDVKERVKARLTAMGKRRNKRLGELELVQSGDWVSLEGQFRGLPAGMHGIQIHAHGDCKEARKKAEHFNPTDTRHGPPDSSRRHVGDLGNIEVDRNGRATFQMRTNSLTVVKDGPSSVLGRVVVITKDKDNGRSQPDGKSGPAIACGVIR